MGESIIRWEVGPREAKIQPNVEGHMPLLRIQESLSELVSVHYPSLLEVILPFSPNCTMYMLPNNPLDPWPIIGICSPSIGCILVSWSNFPCNFLV